MRDTLLEELYMLTGVVDKDINYLYYFLVKDGSKFSEKQYHQIPESQHSVGTLEDWFNNL